MWLYPFYNSRKIRSLKTLDACMYLQKISVDEAVTSVKRNLKYEYIAKLSHNLSTAKWSWAEFTFINSVWLPIHPTTRGSKQLYRNHRRVPTYGYDSQVHDINGSGFAAISPPDGVEIRVRGQNRGFLAWRVHFWGFQTSPTPTSGQKTRKTCIFERNWGPPLSRKVSKSKII